MRGLGDRVSGATAGNGLCARTLHAIDCGEGGDDVKAYSPRRRSASGSSLLPQSSTFPASFGGSDVKGGAGKSRLASRPAEEKKARRWRGGTAALPSAVAAHRRIRDGEHGRRGEPRPLVRGGAVEESPLDSEGRVSA